MTVQAFGLPFHHSRIEHSIMILNRLEESLGHKFRLATLLFERRRFKHHMARHAFKFKGVEPSSWMARSLNTHR